MKKLLLIFLVLSFLPFVTAEDSFVFKQGDNFTLEIAMANVDLSPCTDCSCAVSLFYPNGSSFVKNAKGTNDAGFCKYINSTEIIGTYGGEILFNNSADYGRTTFEMTITTTGKTFTDAQGLGGLGVLGGALALMFFFMILGFKFTETSKPLALLFVVISIFLAIYSLQLGLNYSAGILEWDTLSSGQSTVYVSILYLVAGIGIISFIFMVIAFLREFGKSNMIKNYGAGFDPITQTYQ